MILIFWQEVIKTKFTRFEINEFNFEIAVEWVAEIVETEINEIEKHDKIRIIISF